MAAAVAATMGSCTGAEVGRDALGPCRAPRGGILERDPVAALGPSPRGLGAGGMVVGRYTIMRERVGRGGMAVVYLAEDHRIRQQAAVKLLHPGGSPRALLGRERFRREIRLAARAAGTRASLPLHESRRGGARALVQSMPYVGRRDAPRPAAPGAAAAAGRRRPDAPVRWPRALEYAHRRGVIHRDIKPENLLLDADGGIKVGDFGIGRVFDASALEDTLTRSGVLVGTPAYMSPEQALGQRELDGRTDVYGLGLRAVQDAGGRAALPRLDTASGSGSAGISRIRSRRLRALVPDLPFAVDAVVRRALAKKPGERFSTAAKLAGALAAATDQGGARSWWRLWKD